METVLTKEQQKEILKSLFGFDLINTDGDNWVLYDEDGREFYDSDENCKFDFSTLAGIFSYTTYIARKQGYLECQSDMRKIMGL